MVKRRVATKTNKPKPTRLLYKRRTACEVLDCSVSRLKELERQGVLTPVRLGPNGRDVHYSSTEIEAVAEGETLAN